MGIAVNIKENYRVLGRTCGECTLCCKVMEIEALNKPQGVWCSLVQIGKGCGDYENRPKACRDFECLWLASSMPDNLRPDKIGAVFSGTTDGKRSVIHIDPAKPNVYKHNRKLAEIIEHMRQKFDVIIVCGNDRKLLPSKETALRLAETGSIEL